MAIHESRPRVRGCIGWYGHNVPDNVREIFDKRNYRLELCNESDLENPAFLASAAAIIIVQSDVKPRRAVEVFTKHVLNLLDYDCNIVVVTAEKRHPDGSIQYFDEMLAKSISEKELQKSLAGANVFQRYVRKKYHLELMEMPPTPRIHVYSAQNTWDQIANGLDTPGGAPPSSNLRISKENGIELKDTQKRLLERAFHDCTELHLATMDDEGKSGASVFRGYATLTENHGESWPQPFFIKLGSRVSVFNEYLNYKNTVDAHVPFYLGPRLIYERCHLGANQGIIVGDFVERSESLREAARRGRAVHAISSLFNTTLHGWYRSAKEQHTPIRKWLSFPYIGTKKHADRLAAAKALGATTLPPELRKRYPGSDHMQPLLIGPGHNDLHVANVLVRGPDAILIDFGAHKSAMPILYDLACLEVSLFVDGFKSDGRAVDACVASVAPLYALSPSDDVSPTISPKDGSAWFYAGVSEIRRYARELQRHRGQYNVILAIAFLRKASKDPSLSGKDGDLRAAAYLFGERLLLANCPNNVNAGAQNARSETAASV
jgi:hypothetical protein